MSCFLGLATSKNLLYSSCLLFFRHISQKCSEIPPVFPVLFVTSDEKIPKQSEHVEFLEVAIYEKCIRYTVLNCSQLHYQDAVVATTYNVSMHIKKSRYPLYIGIPTLF